MNITDTELEIKKLCLNKNKFDKKIEKESNIYINSLELDFNSNLNNNFMKYINTKTEVLENDLVSIPHLKAYEPFRNHVLKESENLKLKKGSYLTSKQAQKFLGSVKGDRLAIKELHNSTFFNTPKNSKPAFNNSFLDSIDYTDHETIKNLLYSLNFNEPITSTNLSILQFDLQQIIKALVTSKKLNNYDLKIIELIQFGYNFTEISKRYNTSKQAINKRFNAIVNKICTYEIQKEKR